MTEYPRKCKKCKGSWSKKSQRKSKRGERTTRKRFSHSKGKNLRTWSNSWEKRCLANSFRRQEHSLSLVMQIPILMWKCLEESKENGNRITVIKKMWIISTTLKLIMTITTARTFSKRNTAKEKENNTKSKKKLQMKTSSVILLRRLRWRSIRSMEAM